MVSKRAAKIAEKANGLKRDARMARMEKFIELMAEKEGFNLDVDIVEEVEEAKEVPEAPAENKENNDQDDNSKSNNEAVTGDSDKSKDASDSREKSNTELQLLGKKSNKSVAIDGSE